MKWVSRDEMRAIDRRAIEEFGIPAIILMENAGRGAADEARKLYRERGLSGPMLIFCGAGNNGGDGLVVARHLANAGFEVQVFLTFERSRADRTREAGVNLTVCERMGLPIEELTSREAVQGVRDRLPRDGLIIDAIFGIGLSSPPREPHATLIRILAESRLPVLAIDIPSGLDADTGQVLGVVLPADVTATMACPKLGLKAPQVGRLVVIDISAPAFLMR